MIKSPITCQIVSLLAEEVWFGCEGVWLGCEGVWLAWDGEREWAGLEEEEEGP